MIQVMAILLPQRWGGDLTRVKKVTINIEHVIRTIDGSGVLTRCCATMLHSMGWHAMPVKGLMMVSIMMLTGCHDNRMLVDTLQAHYQKILLLGAGQHIVQGGQAAIVPPKTLAVQDEPAIAQKLVVLDVEAFKDEQTFQQELAIKKSLAAQHRASEEEQAIKQKLAIKQALADQYKLALAEEDAVPKPSIEPMVQAKGDTVTPISDMKQLLMDQYKAWRHVRYRIGGHSKRGIDCSGFMQVTFKSKFDITLPRDTRSQGAVGKRVKKTALRTGDLVFFNTGRNVRHVGVYLDQQKFLHASTSSGVIISDMNNSYWSRRYWQARRVFHLYD
jgi:cell wall-associated NlpC family hydrolase